VNHAFFKALLFLCAGALIHAIRDEQDLRRRGGNVAAMPISGAVLVLGAWSLLGLP
jgi:NADH-quinone oxidoreductase subunit L